MDHQADIQSLQTTTHLADGLGESDLLQFPGDGHLVEAHGLVCLEGYRDVLGAPGVQVTEGGAEGELGRGGGPVEPHSRAAGVVGEGEGGLS